MPALVPSRRAATRYAIAAIGGLLLAAGAFNNAMGNVLAYRSPSQALRFDGSNAVALAAAATLKSNKNVTSPAAAARRLALARAALYQAPISAAAMRAVAVASGLEGQATRSAIQFGIAQTLSRRDLPTQMALIEFCVVRNDIGCALAHYDVALTTSAAGAAPLFPTLSGALGNSEIVRAVAPYIRARRPWITDFMAYLAANSDSAAAASVVIAARGLPPGTLNRDSEAVILGRLGAAQRWDLIRRMYDAMEGPGAAASPLLGFTQQTIDQHRIPVAWQLDNTGSVSAGFEPTVQGRFELRLDFAGVLDGDMAIGHRLTFLAPSSRHMLTLRLADVDLPAGSMLVLSLRCLSGTDAGDDITWRQAGPRSGDYAWRFTVPPSCPVQRLTLLAGGSGQADGSATIQRIRLDPSNSAIGQ